MDKIPRYFGCWRHVGHYLFEVSGNNLVSSREWGGHLDGKYPPQEGEQIEGDATLTHSDGYSIIAFWDRSVDTRGASNSAFLIPGELDFDEALEEAKKIFPMVFKRFEFEVKRAEDE